MCAAGRLLPALAALAVAARGARALSIANAVASATLDAATGGLTSLQLQGGPLLRIANDSWSLAVGSATISPYDGCAAAGHSAAGSEAVLNYTCGAAGLTVQVAYSLRPGAEFVEKRLAVGSTASTKHVLQFTGASIFENAVITLDGAPAGPERYVRNNPYNNGQEVAGFLRWVAARVGAFVSVGNPWGRHLLSAGPAAAAAVTAQFSQSCSHDFALQGPLFHPEHAVLGFTTLDGYDGDGLSGAEKRAFKRCVESYLLDSAARKNGTVKVNVAWDENDYQIDVGTAEGRAEYRRIIDRNSEFGVTHVVYEPRNSLHSSRYNTTDGWGWEGSLWFSMGEQLREGRWDPRRDAVPADILDMVRYAGAKEVRLMAYVYPCLPFSELRSYWTGSGPNSLSLAPPQVQDYFIEVLSAFVRKSGAGGFAWDHDIYSGDQALRYAQWRGWMRILGTLRQRFPELVMDHRQTNHMWGPWYQLAGSYAEPIAGDENPETYGVPIASLHTDHVAADNSRRVNYVYSELQLLPAARIPGFIFHQTERTDDDGNFYCTQHDKLCVNNSNTRDFDLLGYRYSLLSGVGTAGLNSVLTMIPARDPAEYALLPKADRDFIKGWLRWTDDHQEQLRNTAWIPTLGQPRLGSVDGTHAFSGDLGFVFLYNPNMRGMTANLTVDSSIGISSTAAAEWVVTELFPAQGAAVGTWRRGENVSVAVGGSDCRVLRLAAKLGAAEAPARVVHAPLVRAAVGTAAGGGDSVVITEAVGPRGAEEQLTIRADGTLAGAGAGVPPVTINGVRCSSARRGPDGDLRVTVRMEGPPLQRVMPISPDSPPPDFTGGWFNTTFTVSAAVAKQLADRARSYPVPWTHSSTGCGEPHCVDDSKATWLVQTRLLLNPYIAGPSDSTQVSLLIDGQSAELRKSYNSRGLVRSKCFLGFYYDATALLDNPGVQHTAALHVAEGALKAGAFQGLFWENVDTEFTDVVASC